MSRALHTRVEELEAEVDRLSQELDIAQNDLHEAWAQLRELRTSTSWRITAPLRALRRPRMGGR